MDACGRMDAYGRTWVRPDMLTGGTANKGAATTDSAVTGLKALGVRELTYKLCFMACSTAVRSHCATHATNYHARAEATSTTAASPQQQRDVFHLSRSWRAALQLHVMHTTFPVLCRMQYCTTQHGLIFSCPQQGLGG